MHWLWKNLTRSCLTLSIIPQPLHELAPVNSQAPQASNNSNFKRWRKPNGTPTKTPCKLTLYVVVVVIDGAALGLGVAFAKHALFVHSNFCKQKILIHWHCVVLLRHAPMCSPCSRYLRHTCQSAIGNSIRCARLTLAAWQVCKRNALHTMRELIFFVGVYNSPLVQMNGYA